MRTVDLHCRRGGFALHIRGLGLPSSAVGALVGPTGSGKSTALMALAGLVPARCGWRPAAERPGRTILLTHELGLWPHLTVAEHLAVVSPHAGMGRLRPTPRSLELAHAFGLADLLDRRPPTLSWGQRQRLALARAVAAEPELLLLDEPFSGSDPVTRRRLVQGLLAVREERGFAVLLATHDLHVIPRDAWTAVLDRGNLAAQGPWPVLAAAHECPWLQEALAAVREHGTGAPRAPAGSR